MIVEKDGRVISIAPRLLERIPAILIVRDALDTRRQHVIANPLPRAHATPLTPLRSLAPAPRQGTNDDAHRAGADHGWLVAIDVRQYANVLILGRAIGFEQIEDALPDTPEFRERVHTQQPHRLLESLEMLLELEHVQRFSISIPIRAQPLERGRAVGDDWRQNVNPRVRVGNE